jgi:prepilin-type N-terminal cleavage/methylation domain-containing protein
MKRWTKSESGFSLLELLISITVIAFIITSCLIAVRLATASREAGTQKVDLHQRLRVLHERLNSTLRSTNLIFISAESNSLLPDEKEEQASDLKILAFEGKPESLRFVTFSEKLMGGDSSSLMQEVHFYLHKNEETGSLEILLDESNFSPKKFTQQGSLESKTGQTLLIAQDVAYLKFRYYYEISEEETSENPSEEELVKTSGEWTDKLFTEPIDFKSDISDNNSTGNSKEPIALPRAVEVSVGLWQQAQSETESDAQMIELKPFIIPIQVGTLFERFKKEEENNSASEE